MLYQASSSMDGDAISFGPFRLLAGQRLLLEGDKPVRLGSRAFDILAVLVERAGQVVGKEELIARVWPQTFVEESNLKIQVSALRRALGDGQDGHRYIVTVPGQGYNFVASIGLGEPFRSASSPTIAPVGTHNLPLALSRMIGRQEAVASLVSRLSRERLVTIVGPGGIGKTTVALAVAERLIASFEHGVWLVDLAPLSDPRLVLSAVATVLGLGVQAEAPLPMLVAALRDKRLLLLLDNCEHVIDEAASLAVALLSRAPGVAILATSREPLSVAGEGEYRLGPLSSPHRVSGALAAEASAFPAVQLFVERVTASVEQFTLTDANAPLVVEICRRLDGLPLAIEFAAPRVAVLGVEGLAARLDEIVPELRSRRREAALRHRTMRDVIDWSYALLSEDDRVLLRALGVFAGGFTVEAVATVAADAARTQNDATDRLTDLAAKSLVVADVSGVEPRFRLLDTIRRYAIEKLDESGDRDRIARRHAECYRDLFERVESEAMTRPSRERLIDAAREIDNVRAALDWAFSPGGDGPIGVALTAAAVTLWMHLSLLEECCGRVKQALSALGADGKRAPRQEMRLQAALAGSTDVFEMGEASTKALELAESLGDSEYQLRALSSLYFFHMANRRYRAALPFAQKFYDLAASHPNSDDKRKGELMLGIAEHHLSKHQSTRGRCESILSNYLPKDRHADIIRFQYDLRVSARTFLARVLWLQGFPDQARRVAEANVEDAQAINHAPSLCHALAMAACPIALWLGDRAAAKRSMDTLVHHSREFSLPLWSRFGSHYEGVLLIMGDDLDAGFRLLGVGLDAFADGRPRYRIWDGVTELADALGRARRFADGLALVEVGIELAEGGWLAPELLRLKGELLLLRGDQGDSEASEAYFHQALEAARQHGALSWVLRAATSLARLLRRQGRHGDAIACLRPVYDRLTEGFGTADLVAAKQLLDELDEGHACRPGH
jgi:predicted ATPase/DNA-binding winged helix-turn-helix (wHTH) protein